MKTVALAAIAAAALLSGCTTTRAAEERAYCERMAEQMGTGTTHDHPAMKGLPANSMNVTHERCQQVLARK